MFRLMAHPHKTTLVMHNLLCATYLKSAQENCLEIVKHGVKDSSLCKTWEKSRPMVYFASVDKFRTMVTQLWVA